MDHRKRRPERTTGLRNLERTLKIKWTDQIRNEEVYRRMEEEGALWNNIGKRRTRWIGHTLRHNGFVKNMIEGKKEGKVLRGRPRDKYMGQVEKKGTWEVMM
jgi:hypothetical protein